MTLQPRAPMRAGPGVETFSPIRVTSVELTRPLPDPSLAADPGDKAYERTLALVLLHDRPIGTVLLETDRHGASAEKLAAGIRKELGAKIAAHLQADGLGRVGEFGAAGIVVDGKPRCVEERERFLARAPFASVVVATRDRPESLARCLASLDQQDYPAFEIVVVDNAPRTDATRRLLAERPPGTVPVRYIREERPGLASAHNGGVRAMDARSRYVAFTDDDVVADPFWLCELIRGFELADHVGCVTGMIFPAELETWPQLLIEQFGGFNKGFERRIFDTGAFRPDDPLFPYAPGRFGSGANMAFRLDALQAIGGFDPAIGTGTPALGGDDLAAFFQILTAGYALVYEPSAIVHHSHHRDYAALRRQIRGYGVGLTAYLTKAVLDRPSLAFDVARRTPRGLAYALAPRSGKNRKKSEDYPDELTWIERRGMIYGPIAYVRSRRAARAYDKRQLATSATPTSDRTASAARREPTKVLPPLAGQAKAWARRSLPVSFIRSLRRLPHKVRPPRIGNVEFGDLRRVAPIGRRFGFDRGQPIDRVYVEAFLARHADDIRGRVLEVADDSYSRHFGGGRVTATDILDIDPDNPRATIVGDLAQSGVLPDEAFDCIILTQTLQLIFDVRAALHQLSRALRPGGVLLLTVPGITQLEDSVWNQHWYWQFTDLSVKQLLAADFPADQVAIEHFGNVLSAVAFLPGLGAAELEIDEIEHRDPAYQLVIAARATKPRAAG